MLDLKTVKNITIAEGLVKKITNSSGVVLWEVKDTGTTAQAPCYYVAANVSDLPQSLYQAEYAQIGVQKFLITDYHWNVNSKAVVEFEINSYTNEFGRNGRVLAIEGETWNSSYQSAWDVENTTWQTKQLGGRSFNNSTVVPNLNQKCVGEYAETGLTIDGTVITATTPSTSITANTSHYVCIGGYNTPDKPEYLDGKIYSVKIYESGILVRDIVPLTNGLFYDKLSKKVYAAGAGGVCETGGTSTLLVKNEPKYDMAYITSEKRWYALNNKSKWEKYGVIELVSSLDNVTAYDGKLVINTTDKHEYKYINNAWSDQGEVKVTQNVPDGYTTYDYIEQPTVRYRGTGATISAFTGVNGCTYNLKYYMPSANYSLSYYGWIIGECDGISNPPIGVQKLDNGWGTNSRTTAYYHSKWKVQSAINSGNGDIPTDKIFNMEFTPSSLIAYYTDGNVITTFKTSTNEEAFNSSVPLIMWGKKGNDYVVSGKLFELSMKDANGNMVNDCVPATETSSGNKGLFDLVTKTFYKVNDNSAVNMGTEKDYNSYTYPVSYEQYDAPNLNYTECANEAAMKALSCPYEGMKVKLTDTGKKYKFTYNSTTSQYEWDEVTTNYSVNLTVKGNWITSTTNPDSSAYDAYMSNGSHNVDSGMDCMSIKIEGYTKFTVYIRSYAEPSFDYVTISKLDTPYTGSSSQGIGQYLETYVYAHTRGNQQSGTDVNSYTKVEYDNIDGGEHTIYVYYTKDSVGNNNDDRGYILIPKDQ